MVNNRKIETLGITYLRALIDKNDYLQTYFDENDKTPLWDGEIHILKAPSERKSDIFGKVPVQIKATKQKKKELKSFPLSIKDLKLYSENGGFVLFVVLLSENNEQKGIYYKSLPPLEIKNIIKKSKSKFKKITQQKIMVQIHPLIAEKIYPMLVDFMNSSRKQYSFTTNHHGLSIDKIPRNKTIKFYFYGKNPIDIFDYQEEHEIFGYMKVADTDIEIPIETPLKIIETIVETNSIVKIGETIFSNINRHYLQNGNVELHIESGFIISANKEIGEIKLNYSRPDSLSQAIKCTQALIELQRIGYIMLDDNQIKFDYHSLSTLETMNLNGQLQELLFLSNFMKRIGVEKEVDLSLFDEQSQRNLYFLNKGLVLKEEVATRYNESRLLRLKIANIHLLTLYQFKKIKVGKLINIFTETPWCERVEDNVSINTSIFEALEAEDWLKIDNCNFTSVITSYQRLVDMELLYDGADETIIKIISAADLASNNKNRRKVLLEWAQQLSDWNKVYAKNSERAIINDLQIKTRTRNLNTHENNILNDILINNVDNFEICFGATVLLNSKSQADYYWNKLDKEVQQRYQNYPIYTLYRQAE